MKQIIINFDKTLNKVLKQKTLTIDIDESRIATKQEFENMFDRHNESIYPFYFKVYNYFPSTYINIEIRRYNKDNPKFYKIINNYYSYYKTNDEIQLNTIYYYLIEVFSKLKEIKFENK